MNKEKFNYYWKIGLLIAFVVVAIFVCLSLRNFSTRGVVCQSQPFIYGAKVMADKYDNGHMLCTCSITGEGVIKQYSFDEFQENPKPQFNFNSLMGGLNES